MAYVKNTHASYGGLGRAWGLGAATAGATAVAAGSGSGVIAAPPEVTRTYYPTMPGMPGYPGYGYPNAFPGYPGGYPMTTVPTVMSAPPPMPNGNGNGEAVAIMKLPTFVAEDKRRMFKRPNIRSQLSRLGTVAALVGVGLLLT